MTPAKLDALEALAGDEASDYLEMLLTAAPALIAAARREQKMRKALKLFTCASMRETRPTRGESFIGWQKGDGADASTAINAAREALKETPLAMRCREQRLREALDKILAMDYSDYHEAALQNCQFIAGEALKETP